MPPPLDRTSTGCSSPPATDFPDGDHGVDRAGVGRTDVGGHKDGCQAGGNVLPHRGGKVGRVQSVPVVLSRPISPSSWDQPNVSPEPGNVGCFLHGGMRLGLRREARTVYPGGERTAGDWSGRPSRPLSTSPRTRPTAQAFFWSTKQRGAWQSEWVRRAAIGSFGPCQAI